MLIQNPRMAALVVFSGWLVASGSCAAGAALPVPVQLRTENLIAPTGGDVVTISTAQPRFSFLPHAQFEHPGRGVVMAKLRIVVTRQSGAAAMKNNGPQPAARGTVAWDSGEVTATAAVAIPCGVPLEPLARYSWTAQWWSSEGDVSPVSKPVEFEIGPIEESDWRDAQWLGGGQNEFKIQLDHDAIQASRFRLYVASPGGVIIYDDTTGEALSDESGVSVWLDYGKLVAYSGYTISQSKVVRILIGNGFFTSPTACHRGAGHLPGGFCGVTPVARVLVVTETVDGSRHTATLNQTSSDISVVGRFGAVLSDDPWLGTVTDWRKESAAEWQPALAPLPDEIPSGNITALSVEPAATNGMATNQFQATAINVTRLGPSKWHYKFARNIVGHVIVNPESYSGSGNLSIVHCEVMNGTQCGGLAHLTNGLGTDVHILPQNPTTLRPRFTWHGFQHAIITTTPGVHFTGSPTALSAVWTAANLEESATIDFGGPDADLFRQIRDITKAGQISNMAGYIPTDCPTREKHGWLGDAQVTAEEAMYNLFTPSLYELYLDLIQSEQVTNFTDTYFGYVPGVVPGPPQTPDDISWTAAYPLIASWHLKYFGDLSVLRKHWAALNRYMDGHKKVAGGRLPNSFIWGDWCAVEARSNCTQGTGHIAAAANFILATEGMVAIANALGETAKAAKYSSDLLQFRHAFDEQYWNGNTGTYAKDPLETQTLSVVALGSGSVPDNKRREVLTALDTDISSRGYHLTVGSAGQKWLLRELSANGEHETALKLTSQTTEPSWGSWISKGATTCWENWSGVEDATHPGNCYSSGFKPGCQINPPTHNHIFLCGGVGEWMYRSLGGISPSAPGYSEVTIKPEISPSIGPSSVNASVSTVRGIVLSSWVRYESTAVSPQPSVVLDVTVPVGMSAMISIPLLVPDSTYATVLEGTRESDTLLCMGNVPQDLPAWLKFSPRMLPTADGLQRVELQVPAGLFHFVVYNNNTRC